MHWSEFIGGDVVISPPWNWQQRFEASDIPIVSRIDTPVDPKIVDELMKRFPDFRRAYNENGLTLGRIRHVRRRAGARCGSSRPPAVS